MPCSEANLRVQTINITGNRGMLRGSIYVGPIHLCLSLRLIDDLHTSPNRRVPRLPPGFGIHPSGHVLPSPNREQETTAPVHPFCAGVPDVEIDLLLEPALGRAVGHPMYAVWGRAEEVAGDGTHHRLRDALAPVVRGDVHVPDGDRAGRNAPEENEGHGGTLGVGLRAADPHKTRVGGVREGVDGVPDGNEAAPWRRLLEMYPPLF